MNLSEYIETRGDDACAEAWGEKLRTVQSWRLLERYPRPEKARAIVSETGGKVTLDGIYGVPLKKPVRDAVTVS